MTAMSPIACSGGMALASEIADMHALMERDWRTLKVEQDLGLGMVLWLAHFLPDEPWDRSPGRTREADTDDSCFPSESAFGSLHRLGDLCDRCSSLRVRFEFFHVLFRPGTAMRCLFLRRHEQSP
jgi:hypothetical protein